MSVPPGASAIDIALDALRPLLAPLADPSFPPGMPPHVTVLYPWRPAPVSMDDLAELAAIGRRCAPFTMRLGRVQRFPDGLLYVSIERGDALDGLLHEVAAAFPDTPPYGGAIADPVPHVTVRRCASDEECAAMTARIDAVLAPRRPIDVVVDRLTVHERGADGAWRPRAELALG